MTDDLEKQAEGTGEPNEGIEVAPGEEAELTVDDPTLPEAPPLDEGEQDG